MNEKLIVLMVYLMYIVGFSLLGFMSSYVCYIYSGSRLGYCGYIKSLMSDN